MAKLLVYYAHPGHQHSNVNRAMYKAAETVTGITLVDLYAEYPRFEINVDMEQQRLLEHDVILFQYPLFWYSSPSLVKEWIDLVLEHGFAYGSNGDKLTGKRMMLAISAAGPETAYSPEGYQRLPLRTYLAPMERTAGLCHMEFPAPYVIYASLQAPVSGEVEPHADGYRQLLAAIRDDCYDWQSADGTDVVTYGTLAIRERP